MSLYLTIIFAALAIIFGANVLAGGAPLEVLVDIAIPLSIVIVIDLLVAWIVRMYPERKINPFSKFFSLKDGEKTLYDKLKIKKWKDIIPESGKKLCGFAKDKVDKPYDNTYIHKFLIETVYAEVMHEISFVLGFLPMLFCPGKFTIVLWICLVNAFLQALPVMVQRYNRRRLIFLYKHNERAQQVASARAVATAEEEEEDDVCKRVC